MGGFNKRTKGKTASAKIVREVPGSTNHLKPIWSFERVDRASIYRFSTDREDLDRDLLLSMLIEYGNRTWQELMSDTHDSKNKSSHHFLNWNGISAEAQRIIEKQVAEEDRELIFSFRLGNLPRVIGLRMGEKFYVKWYDSTHSFYPSKKK